MVRRSTIWREINIKNATNVPRQGENDDESERVNILSTVNQRDKLN